MRGVSEREGEYREIKGGFEGGLSDGGDLYNGMGGFDKGGEYK